MTEKTHFKLEWGFHGILRLLSQYYNQFSTVLDIGSGPGEHKRFFEFFGKKVYSVDLHHSADYVGDFMAVNFDRKFDVVWCSHVLEHQRNIGQFLEKIYDVIEDNGLLVISVPIHARQFLISGHISNWNAGLLIYNLILAGFDCREASFLQDYDLSLIVQKRPATGGDVRSPAAFTEIGELAQYFPFPVKDGMNIEIQQHGWDTNYRLPALGRPVYLSIQNRKSLVEVQVS